MKSKNDSRRRTVNPLRLNIIEEGRGIEWLTSAALLCFALALVFPGDTLAGQGYRAFKSVGIDEVMLAVPLFGVAAARMIALWINGRWRRSPLLRLTGAVIGTGMFMALCLGFLGPTITSGAPLSTGVGIYFILAFFDAVAAYRSGADVRVAHPNITR
jgi:hypothetical protein